MAGWKVPPSSQTVNEGPARTPGRPKKSARAVTEMLKDLCAEWGYDLLTLPEDSNTKCDMSCGCDREEKFSLSLNGLRRFDFRELPKNRDVWCPRCVKANGKDNRETAVQGVMAKKGWQAREEWSGSYKDSIPLTCEYGHAFDLYYTHLHSRGCPTCSGNTVEAAQNRIEEIAAERGWRLDEYNGSKEKMLFATPGGDAQMLRPQFMKYPPTTATDLNIVRWGDFGWLFFGARPVDLPTEIEKLFVNGEIEALGQFSNKKEALAGFREEMDARVQTLKMLNVWGNYWGGGDSMGQWVSPGTYTWGTIPRFHPIEVTPADAGTQYAGTEE